MAGNPAGKPLGALDAIRQAAECADGALPLLALHPASQRAE